jgi:hypothetical protein
VLTIVNLAILATTFGLALAVYRRSVIRTQMGDSTSDPLDLNYVLFAITKRGQEVGFNLALVVVVLGCALVTYLGTYDLFRSWDQHSHFTPPDAPQAVTVFLAILAGVTAALTRLAAAYTKIIRARGEIDNDRIRAMAELERARPEVESPSPKKRR